jgi:hypothetical protein
MGELNEWCDYGPAESDSHIATEDKIVGKGSEHCDTTWLRSLKRIPPFVRSFNATPIGSNALDAALKAPFSNMLQLFLVNLEHYRDLSVAGSLEIQNQTYFLCSG